jgi:hypothetical protein
VRGRRVLGYQRVERAGDFAYLFDADECVVGLMYRCPCGCGRQGALLFGGRASIEAVWEWDGNLDEPTVTPLIRRRTPCRWTGQLSAGFWRKEHSACGSNW